ncbi:MAG TPA: HIT domain-containing protein [Microlunatus sp.]|nr:HIT domain-containing protein [Microlunatus sp.]
MRSTTTPTPVESEPGCLFCKIVAGDVPSRRIYADATAYAFLDIAPWHRGHTLVIPRRHVVDLVQGPPVLAELVPAVEAVSRLLVDRLGADGLNLYSAAGAVAGQEVFHLHLHLVPRYAERGGMRNLFDRSGDDDLDAVHAEITGPDLTAPELTRSGPQ